MKKTLLNIIFALSALACYAQELRVSAPSHVEAGENFRLTYVISTGDVGDLHLGSMPDGLEIITGPYRSSQSSYQIINGHSSSSSSTTFTFILSATKNGTFKIPSATVSANGHRYASRPAIVKVSGRAAASSGAPRMHGAADNQPQMRPAGSAIRNSDLFIKVSASKNKVYEQEPVVLTYKVYSLVDLQELKGDMPDLTGFHTLEVPLPQQKSFHIENHNGKPYRCVTWSQYIMYPQMSGALKIPSIVFKGSIVQQNRDIDPIEAFLNGGSGYVEVKRDIVAPGLTLNVMPLPAKPANFSGGVGVFNISAQLNKADIKANDPFTIRVVVSGRGNLKLIKQPAVNFPKDFDKYDPKITDKTKITANGLEGNMVYDFIAVARNQGEYTIPPVGFTYFDTQSHTYKTVRTQAFKISVGKGSGGNSSVNDYSQDLRNKDINPIKEGAYSVRDYNDTFFGSSLYWALLVILTIAFAAIVMLMRKYIALGNDTVRSKQRRANRIALKRLRAANDSMLKGNKSSFYDDVLKAMWGYAEEKFNISHGNLNRSNVENVLVDNGIDRSLVEKFMQIIDECEMARYSQSAESADMNVIFEDAMNTITMIDESMKGKKTRHSSALLLVIMLLVATLPASAITKENADNEYKKGNYQQAIKDYKELLKSGKSAELYYNLGNAYYRTDNITYSILCYERALLLSPSDDDTKLNLQIAQSKTIDKITPEPEMFLVQWYDSVVNFIGIDAWAAVSIACLVIAFILLSFYFFSSKIGTRKVGFFGSLLFFAVFLLSISCGYQQKSQYDNRKGAIVISPSLQLKDVPDKNGKDIAVIHEGTRVDIIDDSMSDWKHVRLGDNREGWLQKNQIENI